MTPSGHTSIDGPTEVRDLEKAETSKAVVRGLITDVPMEGGAPKNIDRYISVETYIQHNAEVPDGRAASSWSTGTTPSRCLRPMSR
ncbi:MAG: hypothetical protein KKA32_04835 [Actinobacteria bacterium]|nr:hypothetical protein [Actinomycetota bacterium]